MKRKLRKLISSCNCSDVSSSCNHCEGKCCCKCCKKSKLKVRQARRYVRNMCCGKGMSLGTNKKCEENSAVTRQDYFEKCCQKSCKTPGIVHSCGCGNMPDRVVATFYGIRAGKPSFYCGNCEILNGKEFTLHFVGDESTCAYQSPDISISKLNCDNLPPYLHEYKIYVYATALYRAEHEGSWPVWVGADLVIRAVRPLGVEYEESVASLTKYISSTDDCSNINLNHRSPASGWFCGESKEVTANIKYKHK